MIGPLLIFDHLKESVSKQSSVVRLLVLKNKTGNKILISFIGKFTLYIHILVIVLRVDTINKIAFAIVINLCNYHKKRIIFISMLLLTNLHDVVNASMFYSCVVKRNVFSHILSQSFQLILVFTSFLLELLDC